MLCRCCLISLILVLLLEGSWVYQTSSSTWGFSWSNGIVWEPARKGKVKLKIIALQSKLFLFKTLLQYYSKHCSNIYSHHAWAWDCNVFRSGVLRLPMANDVVEGYWCCNYKIYGHTGIGILTWSLEYRKWVMSYMICQMATHYLPSLLLSLENWKIMFIFSSFFTLALWTWLMITKVTAVTSGHVWEIRN